MNPFQRLRAALALLIIFTNTVLCCIPLFVLAFFKLVIPWITFRNLVSRALVRIAETWISINSAVIQLISRPRWHVEGLAKLRRDQWYLVVSNHQSWADILVLQHVFNRRIPFLKFFLKQELIHVPLLGLAWWALDFPFMKRYSKEDIARDPSLRGKDMETTRKACEKFAAFPISVVNFLEGTRFTQAKHDQQQSPYKHLLRPKSGGVAFTLGAMAGHLGTMVDVTIAYPHVRSYTLFDFLGGAVPEVRVIVQTREIPAWAATGDYENDPVFREQFQRWVNGIWAEKENLLASQQDC